MEQKITVGLNVGFPTISGHGIGSGLSLEIRLLEAFKLVKKNVFGNYVGEMWEANMEEFSVSLMHAHLTAGLPISPKLHIIAQHVRQFVLMNNGQGLGRLNEASVEAIHATFLKIWNLYKVSDEQSATYLQNLLRAVIQSNANNTG